jgi:hypothetical protein
MSHSFPSSGGSNTCAWYTVGGKMSDKNLEQRINIKLCVKVGKNRTKTLTLLKLTYDEQAEKKATVSKWHRRLKEGREVVQDGPRSWQPKPGRTGANVNGIRTLVRLGRRLCETDLASFDFWHFQKLKNALNEQKCTDIELNVIVLQRGIVEKHFSRLFPEVALSSHEANSFTRRVF